MEKNAKSQIVSCITKYLEESNARTRDFKKYKEYWDDTHCKEGCLISEKTWHTPCFTCQKLVCVDHYKTPKKRSYHLMYYCSECVECINIEDGQ